MAATARQSMLVATCSADTFVGLYPVFHVMNKKERAS